MTDVAVSSLAEMERRDRALDAAAARVRRRYRAEARFKAYGIGAVLAAKFIKLEHSVKVLPVGIAMGLLVLVMIPITNSTLATILLIAIGAMGGYFVVPMNALLQHRGHLLMGAGRSIAVQNFNENLSIFAMLGLYAVMQKLDFSIYVIITVFGLLLAGIMTALYKRHGHDQDRGQM